jgi:hypothetical protein
MKCINCSLSFILILILSNYISATSYNSHGQTGLILLPSAEIHDEQSLYLTFNKSSYTKIATLTVTPFKWIEASYFYYRPDDLLWGSSKGLFLDKGFNVKFSYKPKNNSLPRFAFGLDDFAGTGQFSREYISSTYNFNNIKLTSGIGWGKYAGESSFKNPLTFIGERFEERPSSSKNFSLGGTPSTDLWYRGDASFFGGAEIRLKKIRNLSLKIESNPFDYLKYSCCGEGITRNSVNLRKKDSNVNFGISYKYKNFGNIDFSYVKGNTWNIGFSIGLSSKEPLRKKNKFNPKIENKDFKNNKKNEFYLDLLNNLNQNKLYLQTADLKDSDLSLTIDSVEHVNPIIYSSRAAYISKKVSEFNDINVKNINVGHINRGSMINDISYRTSDLDLYDRYPDVLIERNTKINDPNPRIYQNHEFKPRVNYPIIAYGISPDIRTHIGSPQKVLFAGYGVKLTTEIQLNRNFVIYSDIGKSIEDNFDEKQSQPNSVLPHVRTEIVDYLQQSSKDFYVSNLNIESIWSPYNNVWTRLTAGYLEQMFGGVSGELLYKPFNSNFALSVEYNKVKRREYDMKLSFLDYEVSTSHLNVAYYEPKSNILVNWSYGNYLAGDQGYTLDLSRRMPSGWTAGFFFTRTNVSAIDFGEGSFDKGFYFSIPFNVFSKGYSKDYNGLVLRTMTRDGGQKLIMKNKLTYLFYGSTLTEINENWDNFLD